MRRDFVDHRRAQPESPPRLKLCAWFVVCLPSLVLIGSGCEQDPGDSKGAESAPKPIFVEAVQAQNEEFVHRVLLSGSLDAEYAVELKPEIEGVVESFHGVEGGPVSKGDVLFRLKDDEQQARLQEAQANLALAEDVFRRTKRLSSKDISSLARQAEARAGLDAARAKLALAEVQLERTLVRAPFDGVLGSRRVSPGARMDEKDVLISLEAIDRLQIVFTLQEMGIPIARVGAPVIVRVIAWPDEGFPGKVFYVAPSVDIATRRLILKAWVPNDHHRLKPGMFGNVEVEVARKEDALLLPESAMVYDRHGTYVWRVDAEQQAEKVPVEIGRRQGGRVEIVGGIAAGDWIISAGTNKVLAGKRVSFPRRESDDDARATAGSSAPEVKRPSVASGSETES
jgi:membrane fusion protein (multidrug efflux system)